MSYGGSVDIKAFNEAMDKWQPYVPAGYPMPSRFHNPWAVEDPISKQTNYAKWFDKQPK